MRNSMTLGLAAALLVAAPMPLAAGDRTQWEYDGKRYASYEECKRAKDKSRNRAAVVGAASSGTVAAVAGANLGETALVAGAGALAGSVIGKKAKKC
jgi:hypothetical protein